MLGKRPRQMRRTVSVSMMGPESASPELPLDKHRPHAVPVCQAPALHFYEASAAGRPAMTHAENVSLSVAAPVLPFPMEFNIPGPRAWQQEAEAVGLSIVASLHGTKGQTNGSMQDSLDGASHAAVKHKPANQNTMFPLANPFDHKQQRHGRMEPQKVDSSSHRKISGSPVKDATSGMHFLEACFFCKRRLRQGRDIYMYRGDKAFCSEECRHQQILIDERKEKCSLTALKMRTAPQATHANGQSGRTMATSTAAG